MTFKLYSSGSHIQKLNGFNVIDNKYELKVNPNNNNNVHVSVTYNDGSEVESYEKKYDNLENFFNQINNSQHALLSNMQKDLNLFKSMPKILHKIKKKSTQKKKKYKKHKGEKKTKKKLRKPKSFKK